MLTTRTLALLGALAFAGCSKGPDASARTRPPPLVIVGSPEVRDVPVEVRAPVDLRPLAQADVGSKTLGYLDAVLVDRGDIVKRGQTLAIVRPSDLPDQLSAARSSLVQTDATVALARSNLERAQKLAPSGIISQQELQQAMTALATAEAAQSTAHSQVEAVGVRLGETRIESPLDGVVSVRRLDPGALVGPPGGGAIVTVVKVDILRVFISIPERDVVGIEVGKDARVELDALPDKPLFGKVVRVAPTIDPSTRTLDAEVQLPNPNGVLRPGMYGRGAIVKEVHPHATVIPAAALQITDGVRYVFVLSAGDKVERRRIETGVDGGTWLEITKGLGPTEEIVTAGIDGLASGVTVRVTRGISPYTGASAAPSTSAPAPLNTAR
jgi:membrane fusion protein, multidrug efflux system